MTRPTTSPAHIGTYALPGIGGRAAHIACDVGWLLRLGFPLLSLTEPLKAKVLGSMTKVQGGPGYPGADHFPPFVPSGVPPALHRRPQRRRAAHTQTFYPVRCNRCRLRQTRPIPTRLKKSQPRSITGEVGLSGGGKRTPVITSPLSFDLTGVRFQRRARLARGPPNPSALSTYHPTARSEMTKARLVITAHIAGYALPAWGEWL